MKFFQQLLVAPAALGLLAPFAGHAAEIDLLGVKKYASKDQVTSINQFSDVNPTDWAYQALSNLIETYGCVAGYPDGTYRGQRAMTRYEAAALLNACLDRITEITDELKKLMKEFEKELAVVRGRVDGLEAKVGELEANQFSTTTKLQGQATFVIGAVNASGDRPGSGVFAPPAPATLGTRNAAERYDSLYGATSFNYDLRLNFITSFTGKDQLYTRLRTGNFSNAFNGNGVNLTALDVASNGFGSTSCGDNRNCSDVVGIDRLYYRFPIGNQFEAIIGAKYRNTEFLGANPGVYGSGKGDRILDYFSLHGAPGVYNKATGAGGGLIWKTPYKLWGGGFSATASYVAPNGDSGFTNIDDNYFACNALEGGIGNDCSRASFLAQLGWTSKVWGVSAGYRYGQRGSNFRRGTNFVASNSWFLANGESNSVALNAFFQPSSAGFIPSISVGWGLNSLSNNEVRSTGIEFELPYVTESQSWYVGLQWNDVFWGGNSLGMAVGQPTFATTLSKGSNKDLTDFVNDGNYAWEWWYKFQVTDNISVTPAIFWLSRPLGALTNTLNLDGTTDRSNTFGVFGGLVQTTFRF
ncbi:MAG: iron uptake porin [Cyanobium sp.]|jgi:hypothetical protein